MKTFTREDILNSKLWAPENTIPEKYNRFRLSDDAGGLPEGGNFECSIFINDKEIEIESWGYTPSPLPEFSDGLLDDLVDCLIELTLLEKYSEDEVNLFWGLEAEMSIVEQEPFLNFYDDEDDEDDD